MTLPAGLIALTFALRLATPNTVAEAERLAALVRSIQAADYRGERQELDRLATALETIRDPRFLAYRSYWQGFAKWRRALNGFNETPAPPDLESDLRSAIGSFEAALHTRPDWVEARIGVMGCGGPLLFLAGNDAARREAILKKYLPVARGVRETAGDNPRALWLIGQTQLGAPPPYGGDAAKAAATFHRGIEAALAETRQAAADAPIWVPRWGGAENLMNLAYLYCHSPLSNQDLALAYAEGALVAAPEWHYLRDVLMAQIRALSETPGH
jgi:hypothetical protein